jgi:hypothetical protein
VRSIIRPWAISWPSPNQSSYYHFQTKKTEKEEEEEEAEENGSDRVR